MSGGIGRLDEGIERPAAVRLLVLRDAGRVPVRLVDEEADRGLEEDALGLVVDAEPELVVPETAVRLEVLRDRAVLLVARLVVRGLVDDEVDRDLDELGREALLVDVVRRAGAAATGLAVDMVLAAAVSAFAAVVMALVAVFMACIADDMVFADDVALVAAAVILVAADVTLVAAEETVRAAVAGVAELLDVELRLVRAVVLRDLAAVLRVDRAAVVRGRAVVLRDRDAVLRDREAVVLRDDREAGLRAVEEELLPAIMAVELRAAAGLALLAVLAVVFGRLAVPRDALRLTDLLRAVLAELRRVAARVVV
ncbi:MAG TPA: hypothetical protein VEL03_03490 [Streptosporangiaceae bacterium]|nr:hypothetical protein [Streptosporangiaceae bacterium]